MKNYWKQFKIWLASAEIEEAINARLSALSHVFPEFAKLISERQAANAKAAAAKAAERAALLEKVAELDVEIAEHADFQAAVEMLAGK
ncbi:MAG: hypothetical protein UW35_C0016G0021 [Candidatus Collierbacteria bacterium GW2011_GWF2_44_15]|uniref:Uncharacterized protein n=4 Tax=Candidatus Collieribacteriota TaxID=1752725 RepID=A0A0G1HID1_9BACT|nr:MAG: hypothetical protein UW23_C0001G0013 [Candidatus Collierbacteria bacterium GW2011_GWA1_44_12]KKT46338.1 MAG: hypothetical protein UW35_C0016G0021 [Candidatus Collierbacteria bacterium GW2011_GWF2_44_15]KKU00187.1 MAG: hypothetical protein UW99_C0003G0008 [Candidatus Collierbacteria bacterium GW2011_GWC2_45_15]KKU30424.1 MAG: hypothetical protein UX41_C0004G0008 [Candidatus Collierbacteria bacterium GW2011_GWE1_46_18]